MRHCVSITHPDVTALAEQLKINPVLAAAKIGIWQDNNKTEDFPTYNELVSNSRNEVEYQLRAVNILLSDKGKEVFNKGQKNNWSLDKILTELQVPNEQKQLILQLNLKDREDIALELATNYSYTVQINTTKEKLTGKVASEEGMYVKEENGKYYLVDAAYNTKNEITKREYEDFNNNIQIPTHHYSNMTVPGGTNYIEQELSTPLITPSIKGHAQFSTNNGIGWFRSDDKIEFLDKEDLIRKGIIKQVPCG